MPSGEPHRGALGNGSGDAADTIEASPYEPGQHEHQVAGTPAAAVCDLGSIADAFAGEDLVAVRAAYFRVSLALAVRDADALLAEMTHDVSYASATRQIGGRRRAIAAILDPCAPPCIAEESRAHVKLIGAVATVRRETVPGCATTDFIFRRRGRRWRLIAIRDRATEAEGPSGDVAGWQGFRPLPSATSAASTDEFDAAKVEDRARLISS